MVDNIYDLKKAVKELLAARQVKQIQPNIESHISDSQLNDIHKTVQENVAPKVITLTPSQKGDQVEYEYVPSIFEQWADRAQVSEQLHGYPIGMYLDPNDVGNLYGERREVRDDNPDQRQNNDISAGILIKTIIDQVITNRKALAKYHNDDLENKYEFKFQKNQKGAIFTQSQDLIVSAYNLGKFLGVTSDTLKKWNNLVDDPAFTMSEIDFRKINSWVLKLFKGGGSGISEGRNIITASLSAYINKFFGKMDYITKILFLLDECAEWDNTGLRRNQQAHSEVTVSEKLSGKTYLQSARYSSENGQQFEEYSKYFRLTTNLQLLDEGSFKWVDLDSYNKFKKEVVEIIFQEMVDQGIYSDEDEDILEGLRVQHYALVDTLYALTCARFARHKDNPSGLDKFKHEKNPNGLYTLTYLSKELGRRQTLSDRIRCGTFITPEKINGIKGLLESNSEYAHESCEVAINSLEEVPKYRYQKRPSYVGRLSHHLWEEFFLSVLSERDGISEHEYMFNYPDSHHKIDTFIDIASQRHLRKLFGSGFDMSSFKRVFIDYNIPSLSKIHKTIDKIGKYCLSSDNILIVPFYGEYSNEVFSSIKNLLPSYNSKYKNNGHFIDIVDFGKLLNLNDAEMGKLLRLNDLIKGALKYDDKLDILEDFSDKALETLMNSDRYLGKKS